MAEHQFTTTGPQNGPQEHLWTRLFRIQGLSKILHAAANTHEELSGEAVEEVAMMINELSREAMDDLATPRDETKRNIAVEKHQRPPPLMRPNSP